MKTQTFTGTVLDTAGDPWEDALVELQLDDGTGEISIAGPTVTGVTDASGDFSIDAYNNSDEEQTLLIRLPNGNLFSAAIDPEDDTIALGDLESSGGTDTVKLSVIPSAGSDPTAAIAAALTTAGKRTRVRAAATGNITIATALNNGDTLDGVTLATGDLVLAPYQTAGAENGIYVVGTTPARHSEFDTYDEHPGSLIVVEEGTVNADTFWLCTSNLGGTLDTTAIAFEPLNLATETLTDGATITWTFIGKESRAAQVTLGGNRTLAITGAVDPASGVLYVTQDGTGSRTLTLPANSKVIGGGAGAVTLTTTAGAVDILSFVKRGSNYYWTVGLNFT